MQITRRNALVSAGAAMAVAGVPGAALEASEPLVALEADLMEARAAGGKVGALYCTAHDKAGDWAFGWPLPEYKNPVVALMRDWLSHNSWLPEDRVDLGTIKKFNRLTEMSVFMGDEVLAQRKAEGRERIRWWIKARRAQQTAQEAVGLPEIHALLDSNHECVDAIEDALWDTPAETLRGVLIRLREAHRDYVAVICCDNPHEDFYAVAFGKVLADLERLTGGLPS